MKTKKLKKKNQIIISFYETKGATSKTIKIVSKYIKAFPGKISVKLKIITKKDIFIIDKIGFKISYEGIKKLEFLCQSNKRKDIQIKKCWI